MSLRLVKVLLVFAACWGCRPPAAVVSTVGETSGTKTWSMPSDGAGVPGLDGGSVYFIGTRFVVWAAEGRGGGGGSTSNGRDGTNGDGQVSLTGGQKVTFSFSMPAGQPGTATVDGTTYDLAKGRVFLVKPVGDKLVIRQTDVDLSGVNPGTADLAAVGRAAPAVREFFEPGK